MMKNHLPVEVVWIPNHTQNERNEEVDQLAKKRKQGLLTPYSEKSTTLTLCILTYPLH